jgi:hypothetical protein
MTLDKNNKEYKKHLPDGIKVKQMLVKEVAVSPSNSNSPVLVLDQKQNAQATQQNSETKRKDKEENDNTTNETQSDLATPAIQEDASSRKERVRDSRIQETSPGEHGKQAIRLRGDPHPSSAVSRLAPHLLHESPLLHEKRNKEISRRYLHQHLRDWPCQ